MVITAPEAFGAVTVLVVLGSYGQVAPRVVPEGSQVSQRSPKGTRPPKVAQGPPKIPKGLPKVPKALPKVPKGLPKVSKGPPRCPKGRPRSLKVSILRSGGNS